MDDFGAQTDDGVTCTAPELRTEAVTCGLAR
jgi:hypothetical protein